MGKQHDELVARAVRWLHGTGGCAVVATEKCPPHLHLVPDAIGWTRKGYSIVIECKVSRSDWLADRRKPARSKGIMLGDERWLMTPPGLVQPDELERGQGLLEVHPGIVRRASSAVRKLRNLAARSEAIMLAHVAWHACVMRDALQAGEPAWQGGSITAHDAIADELSEGEQLRRVQDAADTLVATQGCATSAGDVLVSRVAFDVLAEQLSAARKVD